jgi:hypothetical protein
MKPSSRPVIVRSSVPRLIGLLAATAAALLVGVSPASASPSAPGSGIIFWASEIGCGAQLQVGGSTVTVFSSSSTFLAGTLFDARVGWMCTGSAPPDPNRASAFVVTGLTCVISNAFYPAFGPPPGTLSGPGTAIFQPDGTVRLICPPGQRV